MNERRRKNDDSDMDIELHVTIQRLSDQMERFIYGIESEKESRRRTNEYMIEKMESIRAEFKSENTLLKNSLMDNFRVELKVYEEKLKNVRDEYRLTRIIVYALCALILIAFVKSLLDNGSEPPSGNRGGNDSLYISN